MCLIMSVTPIENSVVSGNAFVLFLIANVHQCYAVLYHLQNVIQVQFK